MFTKRSKDGILLIVVHYSFIDHAYIGVIYIDSDYMDEFSSKDISIVIDRTKEKIEQYDSNNPATRRYHKLSSGDIYDNQTETVINYNALIGLLTGLENDDKYTIADAIADLID